MEVLRLNKKNYQKVLKETVRAIEDGQVVACPTDTVYGLICDAADKEAMGKLFLIKQRPSNKPIPIFVKDVPMAKEFAEISKKQERFLKKVWPGAVTVVLKSKKGEGNLGIRIPKHKLILDIIEMLGRPLAETSANVSGKLPTTKIKEVLKYFEGRDYQPDLILDDGDLRPAKPSQVIDLTGLEPVILRK